MQMAHGDSKFTMALAQARAESRALLAIRDIVVAGERGAVFRLEDTIRTIAAAARTEALEAVAEDVALGTLVHKDLDDLPFPVLARTGQGHLEVQWTQYLAHAFRFGNGGSVDGVGPLGRRFAQEIAKLCGHTISNDESLRVHVEVSLGERARRARSPDLLLRTAKLLIGIEHKTVSGTSDSPDVDGESGKQLDAQFDLLAAKAKNDGLQPHAIFLARGKRERLPVGWVSATHADVIGWLADELQAESTACWRRPLRGAAVAFLVDLVECHGGTVREAFDVIAAWHRAPANFALAMLLLQASRNGVGGTDEQGNSSFGVARNILGVCDER